MTHIIKDRWFFWTYYPELATLVGTANCEVLNTLAQGEVHFQVLFQGWKHIVCMWKCLHALDIPINLLLVGAMAEKSVCIIFEKDAMTIHFPRSAVDINGVFLSAAVAHHLLLLHCNFLLPPLSSATTPLPANTLAFSAIAEPTPPLFFLCTPVDSGL